MALPLIALPATGTDRHLDATCLESAVDFPCETMATFVLSHQKIRQAHEKNQQTFASQLYIVQCYECGMKIPIAIIAYNKIASTKTTTQRAKVKKAQANSIR